MLTRPTDNLDPLITTADVHYRTRRLGWTFWVCEDMLPRQLCATWHANGFPLARDVADRKSPGMYAEDISARVKPPAPLTFARVGDRRTRLEFAHIASIVFSLAVRHFASGSTARPAFGSHRRMDGWAISRAGRRRLSRL